jgi:MFS family permease
MYLQRLRQFDRDVWLALLAFTFVFGISYGVWGVLFNLYLVRLGYDTQWIGLVTGISYLAFAGGAALTGIMPRWRSTRDAMIIGVFLRLLGSLLAAQAELAPHGWQTLWIVAAMAVANGGSGLYISSNSPYLIHASREENRGHAFAVLQAMGPVAAFLASVLSGLLPGVVAPLLGVTLGEAAPYRWVLTLGALLLFAPVAFLMLTRPEARIVREKSATAGPFPLAIIAVVCLTMLLRWGGLGPIQAFLPVYMDRALHSSTALIGGQAAAAQLASIPAALLAALAIARWGKVAVFSRGVLMIAVCLLPLALIPHWGAAAFSNGADVALWALVMPAFNVFTQEAVRREWRPVMAAGVSMSNGLGQAVMSLGGGFLIASVGYRALFLLCAGLICACGLVFGGYFGRSRQGAPSLSLPTGS